MHSLGEFRLGKSPDEVSIIETRKEAHNIILELTKQSSRKLNIISKT